MAPRKKSEDTEQKEMLAEIGRKVDLVFTGKAADQRSAEEQARIEAIVGSLRGEVELTVYRNRAEGSKSYKINGKKVVLHWQKGTWLGTWDMGQTADLRGEILETFGGGEYLIRPKHIATGKDLKPSFLKLGGDPMPNRVEHRHIYNPGAYLPPGAESDIDDDEEEKEVGITHADLMQAMEVATRAAQRQSAPPKSGMSDVVAALPAVLEYLSEREQARSDREAHRLRLEREERQRQWEEDQRRREERRREEARERQRQHEVEMQRIRQQAELERERIRLEREERDRELEEMRERRREERRLEYEKQQWERGERERERQQMQEMVRQAEDRKSDINAGMSEHLWKAFEQGSQLIGKKIEHELSHREKISDFEMKQKLKALEKEANEESHSRWVDFFENVVEKVFTSKGTLLPGQVGFQSASPPTPQGATSAKAALQAPEPTVPVRPEFFQGLYQAIDTQMAPTEYLKEALQAGVIQEAVIMECYNTIKQADGPAPAVYGTIGVLEPYCPKQFRSTILTVLQSDQGEEWALALCHAIVEMVEAYQAHQQAQQTQQVAAQ